MTVREHHDATRGGPSAGRSSHGSTMVILLVLAGVFALGVLPRLFQSKNGMVGKPIPRLVLPTLTGITDQGGQTINVDVSELRGQVVVLDFWSPSCQPCRHEMPVLDRLARKLARENITVLGVLVEEDRSGARAFLREAGIQYRQLDDAEGTASRLFAVESIPTIVIVDRRGTVHSYRVGYSPEADVELAIRAAM